MSFVNLHDLGSPNIPNTDGGKCLRRYNKKQTSPSREEKRFRLVFRQSSVDSKSEILQERPRSLSPNMFYMTKQYQANMRKMYLT